MEIRLHKNARTTPAIRRELQASTLPTKVLAAQYNLSPLAVRKWRRRDGVEDASHRPHRLSTMRSPAQEALVVALRETLLLPLDDLLVVPREFIHPKALHSALDHCLRRHGVSNLKTLIQQEADAAKRPVKSFKDYEPGPDSIASIRSVPSTPSSIV